MNTLVMRHLVSPQGRVVIAIAAVIDALRLVLRCPSWDDTPGHLPPTVTHDNGCFPHRADTCTEGIVDSLVAKSPE